jgi:chaperone modulatory protein CbpM
VSTPPRTRPGAPIVETSRRAEAYLSSEELARVAGISAATLARLMSLGIVEPMPNERKLTAPTFSAATASRLRRMLRLHRDLGVNLTGAAIIVDLVERLEREPGGPGR